VSPAGHWAARGVKEGHRQDIDALRAIAVSLALVFHTYPSVFPQGFIGIDIFFVTSGFLITSIIHADLQQGRFSFFVFYAWRCRRVAAVLLGATSLGLTFVLADQPSYVLLGFPTRASELTLGCALALWTAGRAQRAPRTRCSASASSASWCSARCRCGVAA